MLSTAIATLLMHAVAPAAHAQVTEPRLLRTPDIHGDTVVFSYAGDLWVAKTDDNAVARRLTSHPGFESYPHISPDGKWVAFTGQYDGAQNVYVIPIEGGEPKRLTYSTEGDTCLGWTPDGKVTFASRAGGVVPDQASLWIVDPKGGIPMVTAIKEIGAGHFFADGHRVAYTRTNSYLYNWRRYRGGTQGRISIYDLATNQYSELPSGREQSYHPMPVGDDIFYISDRGTGVLNLYRHSGNQDNRLTNFTNADIRFPSTDGTNIVFEDDGLLFEYNIANSTTKKLTPVIDAEDLASRPALRNLVPFIESISVSPSGARVAVEARGKIFSVATKHGETRNMNTASGVRQRGPQWSPDGKSIAYVSDESGEWQIYTQPQMGGPETQITSGATRDWQSITWTPDSKALLVTARGGDLLWIDVTTKQVKVIDHNELGYGGMDVSPNGQLLAYVKATAQDLQSLFVYNMATGKSVRVTGGLFSDQDVAFDQNGQWLYFLSVRTFKPTPGVFETSLKIDQATKVYAVPINGTIANPFLEKDDEEGTTPPAPGQPNLTPDLEGVENRVIALPLPVGNYVNLQGASGGFFIFNEGVLLKYDMGTPAPTPIYVGLPTPAYNLNPARTKLAVTFGGKVQVLDVHPGLTAAEPGVDLGNLEAVVDYKAEWKEEFWDAWRYIRDNYYDPQMRGMDWVAIGKKYEPDLQYMNCREDLNYLLGLLLGELGTGHSYITDRGDQGLVPVRLPVGYLGADFDLDGDKVRFKKVFAGRNDNAEFDSPLGHVGINVKAGDYLLAIDGHPVNQYVNPASLLVGKVGKLVSLTVNSIGSMTGAREVRVRPVPTEANIRYADWLARMRKHVDERSHGQIAYMHIRDTAATGSEDFVTGFYTQYSKPAMLVDERWNHGGYPQPWFVNTLARSPQGYASERVIRAVTLEPAHVGPKAMLINQYAGSGGDFFPYMFRLNKLGPLIGKRTWGGLIGINDGYGLEDGGRITTPSFAIYNPDSMEIIAENSGIDPDQDVDLRPDLLARGEDPQLDAAIDYLMGELAKHPPRKLDTKLPVVQPKGRIDPNGK